MEQNVSKAASILEEAKKLWQKVSSRRRAPAEKMQAIEGRVQQLEEEAAASYEVVNSMAQQHSSLSEQLLQLAQAVEDLRAANRRLWWTCGALALVGLAALILPFVR